MFGSGKVDEPASSERFFCRFGRVGQQQVHQRAVDSGDVDVFVGKSVTCRVRLRLVDWCEVEWKGVLAGKPWLDRPRWRRRI